jgi:hypothetical protein
LLQRSVGLNPGLAAYHDDLGVALRSAERMQEGSVSFIWSGVFALNRPPPFARQRKDLVTAQIAEARALEASGAFEAALAAMRAVAAAASTLAMRAPIAFSATYSTAWAIERWPWSAFTPQSS